MIWRSVRTVLLDVVHLQTRGCVMSFMANSYQKPSIFVALKLARTHSLCISCGNVGHDNGGWDHVAAELVAMDRIATYKTDMATVLVQLLFLIVVGIISHK